MANVYHLYRKAKANIDSQDILEEEEQEEIGRGRVAGEKGRLILPVIKANWNYSRTVCYWCKDKQIDQWHRIENSDTARNLLYSKSDPEEFVEKEPSLNKKLWDKWMCILEK